MKIKITALAIALSYSSISYSQIPTTDTASIAMQTAQWAKQLQEMKIQYDEMKRHWEKMDDMEKLVSGSRYLGTHNVEGINGQIPPDINSIYSGSLGKTQQIMRDERISGTFQETKASINERNLKVAASNKAAALTTYQGALQRLENINNLISKIQSSEDPKTIQDLQARISGEQALIQNENSKLAIVSQLANAESQLIDDQRRQLNRDILSHENTGMPEIR